MSTSIFNPRLFESRFIALYMAVCVYYFYLQWPNFALNGDYRGADPSVKLSNLARSYNHNTTADYFSVDRQVSWHQRYYGPEGFSDGGFFQYGHCAAAYFWWAGMFLQLSGAVRKYSVNVHQYVVGPVAFISGQALALSGLYGLLSGGRLDLTANAYYEDLESFEPGMLKTGLQLWLYAYIVTFWLHGFYLAFTGWMYLYCIYIGDRPAHRRWILRHMMVGFATLTKRVMFMCWPYILMYAPVDLHWIPGSVVKATCANLPIYLAHPFAEFLMYCKRGGLSSIKSGKAA